MNMNMAEHDMAEQETFNTYTYIVNDSNNYTSCRCYVML